MVSALPSGDLATSIPWHERLRTCLQFLADRPVTLLLLAFCASTAHVPYVGLIHDARLYAIQVNNRLHDGAYGSDLFLHYGSQDQYTLFSTLLTPAARMLGISGAFFLAYLLSLLLFLAGTIRLLRRTFGSNPETALACFFLAIDPIGFGNAPYFQVNEPFLTPRLPACGLVLLGVSFLVESRWLFAILFIVLAGALHPIMAMIGFALLVGWALYRLFGDNTETILLVLGSSPLVALLVFVEPTRQLFGTMDATWFEQVRLVVPYNFPITWNEPDWRRIVLTVVIVLATTTLPDLLPVQTTRLLRLVVFAGMVGLGVTLLAGIFNDRLLLQVQPYRMLWLLHYLAIPCGITWVSWAIRYGSLSQRALPILLTGLYWFHPGPLIDLALPAFLGVIFIAGYRGMLPQPRRADWLPASLFSALLLGSILRGLIRFANNLGILPQLAGRLEGTEILYLLSISLEPATALALFLLLLLVMIPRTEPKPTRLFYLFALALLVQFGLLVTTQTSWYQHRLTPRGAGLEVVNATIGPLRQDRPPVIYWPQASITDITLNLEAVPYFEIQQLSGLLYHAETAREAFRRARLVAPFELAPHRTPEAIALSETSDLTQRVYGIGLRDAVPSREHLLRLAQDPLLDFIIVPNLPDVPHLGTVGDLAIYHATQLRLLATSTQGHLSTLPTSR